MIARDPTIDPRFILPFETAAEADHPRMGGKCASLARMIALGVPVPRGFAVATDAYAAHLAANGLDAAIRAELAHLDTHNATDEEARSQAIRRLVTERAMPAEVEAAIRAAYAGMSPAGDLPVAVRSSATAEDMPDASFAGQQDTYLWVVGADEVVDRVRACWASLFTARAMSYRADHHLGQIEVLMAVAVQEMVDARSAGVAMTLDPINGDRTKIVIDASWGLGESVVSGEITPDNFVVEKVLMQIQKRRIAEKTHEVVADPAARRTVDRVIEAERRTQPCLSDDEVIAVAQLARRLEKAIGGPQDIEWAIDRSGRLVALQCRPETVWSQRKAAPQSFALGIEGVLGTLMAPVRDRT
ncbi:MAG: PEP/pyruvate-binding domain-containing protein [Rhodobacteraceae bacterium]|nr:PEP/pyruvate-binding domain-containing protein [Paracoccaceae bacterium]